MGPVIRGTAATSRRESVSGSPTAVVDHRRRVDRSRCCGRCSSTPVEGSRSERWCGCAGSGAPHGERNRRSRTSRPGDHPVVVIANDGQQLRVGEPETDSLLLVAAVPRITGPIAVQRRHGGGDIEPAGSVPTWSGACPLTRLRRGQMLWSCWTMLDRANRRKPPLARCRQARTA